MKRFFALLSALFLVSAFSIYSLAINDEYIIDDADLLSNSEEIMLSDEIEEIIAEHNISVVVHTTFDTDGKEIYAYADDFYDNGDYLEDGLVFVISMTDRDYYTSTAGYLVDSLTAYDLEIICEDVVPCLSNGDYYKAFSQYLSQLRLFLNGELDAEDDFVFAGDFYYGSQGVIIDDDYNYSDDDFASSTPSDLIIREFVLLIIAVVIAVIITMILKSKMNTAVKKHDADDYVVQGSFNLTAQRDAFIGSTVTKRPLPKENNGSSRPGGGGGVRVSSGGVRHGGGGGKF